MPCPKCDYHSMRLLNGLWECRSPSCDYREDGSKSEPTKTGLDVFMKDPEVTRKELVRVHDMSIEETIHASGRGRSS